MLINIVNICGEDFFILQDQASLYILAIGMIITFTLLRKDLINQSLIILFFCIISSLSLYVANKADVDKKELKLSLIQRSECIDSLNEKFPITVSEIPDLSLLTYKGKDKKIFEELAYRYEIGTNNIPINLEKAQQIRKSLIPATQPVTTKNKSKGK